ncbi:MAG: hypothetical protein ACFB2W_15310 [Leptolyngbyaceae cyanobacterium]
MVISIRPEVRATFTKTRLQQLENKALEFLAFSDIVSCSGDVFSWLNSQQSGYIYPEIMGYYLTFGSQYLAAYPNDSPFNQCLSRRVHRVAQRLQQLVHAKGGIGRGSALYLFDTAMAITGLLTYGMELKGVVDATCLDRMTAFVCHAIQQQQPVVFMQGQRCALSPRWSTEFGSSMLKVVICLNRLSDWTGDACYRQQGQRLVENVMAKYLHQGAFTVLPKPSMVYTHAHCYALEGLLDIHCRGDDNMMSYLTAGADCLQRWQNQNGSLFNWNRMPHPVPMQIGDATAQAVRIWLAVDCDRYQTAIQRGLNFLDQLSTPQGGLYYGTGSDDINSWVTMFAAQALDWYLRGSKPRCLV